MIEFTIHEIDATRRRVTVTFHLDTPIRVRAKALEGDWIYEDRMEQRSNVRGLDCDWTDEQDIVRAIREYAQTNYTLKPRPTYGIVGKRFQV